MSWKHTGSLDKFIMNCLAIGRYRATTDGHVINTNFRNSGRERQLAECADARGYLMCEMWDGERRTTAMVHRVICLAFHGRPPVDGLFEVNHRSGVKKENNPENLEWVTISQNRIHALKTGLAPLPPHIGLKGENHHMSKIGDADIAEIFRLRRAGWLQKEIAAKFGLTPSHVSAILLKKAWRHLNRENP